MCAKTESCTTNAERNGGLQNKDKIVDKFTWETEQGVIDAAKPTGCDTASRYWVDIDLSVVEAASTLLPWSTRTLRVRWLASTISSLLSFLNRLVLPCHWAFAKL